MIVWFHLIVALTAVGLGTVNLAMVKGTPRHRLIGWAWMACMLCVTVSSFWIREINPGSFSWIHGLTVWTLISMGIAIFAIRTGRVKMHAGFMTGTMIGAIIAGGFAFVPGRFISTLFGY